MWAQENVPQTQEPWWRRVTVTGGLLTSLGVCGCRCQRSGLGRPGRHECPGQGLEGEGKASAGERSSQPGKEMSRAARETGARSDLWQVVCSGNLISTSEAHCELPASRSTSRKAAHYFTHKYHLRCLSFAGLWLGSLRSRCGCWESPSASSKVTSK